MSLAATAAGREIACDRQTVYKHYFVRSQTKVVRLTNGELQKLKHPTVAFYKFAFKFIPSIIDNFGR